MVPVKVPLACKELNDPVAPVKGPRTLTGPDTVNDCKYPVVPVKVPLACKELNDPVAPVKDPRTLTGPDTVKDCKYPVVPVSPPVNLKFCADTSPMRVVEPCTVKDPEISSESISCIMFDVRALIISTLMVLTSRVFI